MYKLGQKVEGGVYAGIDRYGKNHLIVSPRIISNDAMTWKDAVRYANEYRKDKFKDWSLMSTADFYDVKTNALKGKVSINDLIPSSVKTREYWSPTVDSNNAKLSLYSQVDGEKVSFGSVGKTSKLYVRAIRKIPVVNIPLPKSKLESRLDRLEDEVKVLKAKVSKKKDNHTMSLFEE